MKRTISLIGWMVFTGNLFVGATPGFVDYDLGWVFPSNLGGLPFAAVEKYESDDFGYTVFYRQGESMTAEVSIHTLGERSIPNGCKGAAIQTMLDRTEAYLNTDQTRLEIFKLKKRGTIVVPSRGEIRFSTVVFQYDLDETNGTKRVQATYVTGRREKIVKLVFTFNIEERRKAKEMEGEMIKQLITTLQSKVEGDDLLLASCSVYLNDPLGYAGKVSVRYLMDEVAKRGNVSLYLHLLPSEEGYEHENASLLTAAYVAGVLQSTLPKKRDEGGDFGGFIAMLNVYTILREKDQITPIPKLDKWNEAADKKVLFKQLME